MTIEGEGLDNMGRGVQPPIKKPTLRQLCYAFGIFDRGDIAIFRHDREEMLKLLEPRLPQIRAWSEEQGLQYLEGLERSLKELKVAPARAVEAAAPGVLAEQRMYGRPDFSFFTKHLEEGTLVVEVPAGQIGAIHEEEPGFLKGCMYILGRLFHAQFIRVKYRNADRATLPSGLTEPKSVGELEQVTPTWAQALLDAEDARYNEDGDGEQVPWNEDPESLCYQWWHQSMVHVDECVFGTVEVPGFVGHYVLLIHPGSR